MLSQMRSRREPSCRCACHDRKPLTPAEKRRETWLCIIAGLAFVVLYGAFLMLLVKAKS